MNLVKIVLGIAIVIIGLSGIAQIFMISDEPYLDEPYLDEPTHLMTEEEMIQICIEEGIPLE